MRSYTQRHDRIKERLRDWASWRSDWACRRGWQNINASGFDPLAHVQRRNDTHSDPVYTEIRHLSYDEWRIETTEKAYQALIPKLKSLIYARYIEYPDGSDRVLAEKIGADRKLIKNNLSIAYEFLEHMLHQLSDQKHNIKA